MNSTTSASSHDYGFSQLPLHLGTSATSIMDTEAFKLYIELKNISIKYKLESKLQIPQLVIVGETSVGKSMLVQYFLRFPCSFSQANIATRCPVAYCLRYNSQLNDGEVKIIKPVGITPQTLASHLQEYMRNIELTDKFCHEAYTIELESTDYSDLEILDIPGLVTGERDEQHRNAVERITEAYVRDKNFMIVQLREAQQPLVNANGMLTIHKLCTDDPAKYNHHLPARLDYLDHTVTIQTKFNVFMSENTNAKDVNKLMEDMKKEYKNKTYFTNMIFDGYAMSDRTFEENVRYIADLPELEKKRVDKWIIQLNQAPEVSTKGFQRFQSQNRSLIGINMVRRKIQELWTNAIRSALPDLRKAIYEQLMDARQEYAVTLRQLEQKDPVTVRKHYLSYLNDFHQVFTLYINAKSETDIAFKYSEYGKTYADIESKYMEWPRRIPHIWRAYLSYNEMKHLFTNTQEYGEILHTLDRPLTGARHFHRLEQVFKAMVYTFRPRELSRGEIESAESHIAHSISTGENLEKAVRELIRSLIRDTFLMGICWLTQMYTFLCHMLYNDVTKYFISSANRYPHLKTHFRFLHCAELSYHRIVHEGVRESLQLIKLTRNAATAYLTHDLTAIIKKLAYSIPAEIKHTELNPANEKMITSKNERNDQRNAERTTTDTLKPMSSMKIQNHLYASASHLYSDRNPQTANHHDHGRNVIVEMYSAVRGLLIHTIIAAFNTNLLIKLHEYNTIQTDIQSLRGRIIRMRNQQITKMADVKFDEIQKELTNIETEIIDLEYVLSDIDNMMKQPNSDGNISGVTSDGPPYDQEEVDKIKKQQFRKELNIIEGRVNKLRTADNEIMISKENDEDNGDDNNEDYESELIKSRSKIEANQILANIYKKDDSENMEAAFLKGESLNADEGALKTQHHVGLDHQSIEDADFILGSFE